MLRGEARGEFDPSVDSGIRKTRAAFIVSNDSANRHLQLEGKLGSLTKADLLALDDAIKIHLALPI